MTAVDAGPADARPVGSGRDRRPDPGDPARPPDRDQRGGGSMLMIGVCVVVMMLGYTAMIVVGYVIAGHRVRAAADLAALSGATSARQGGDPCEAARRNARAHGAQVTTCERVGDQIDFVVTVTATVTTDLRVPGLPRRLSATAYAGAEEVRDR